MEETVHVNVRVPTGIVQALALRAKEQERTFSAEVRLALAAAARTPEDDDPGVPAEVVGSSPAQVASGDGRG